MVTILNWTVVQLDHHPKQKLEKKQERGGETEGIIRIRAISSKVEQCKDTIATDTTALSLAKKTRSFSTAGTNKAYSNRRDWKNECSNDAPQLESKVCTMQPIYYGYKQEKSELLQLWRFWTFSEKL